MAVTNETKAFEVDQLRTLAAMIYQSPTNAKTYLKFANNLSSSNFFLGGRNVRHFCIYGHDLILYEGPAPPYELLVRPGPAPEQENEIQRVTISHISDIDENDKLIFERTEDLIAKLRQDFELAMYLLRNKAMDVERRIAIQADIFEDVIVRITGQQPYLACPLRIVRAADGCMYLEIVEDKGVRRERFNTLAMMNSSERTRYLNALSYFHTVGAHHMAEVGHGHGNGGVAPNDGGRAGSVDGDGGNGDGHPPTLRVVRRSTRRVGRG